MKRHFITIFIFLGLLVMNVVAVGELKLVMFDKSASKMRCLDDSPYGFYIRMAEGTRNKRKWIINLQGGGECVTEKSCKSRAQTDLGSSHEWKSTRSPELIQSSSTKRNPDFYDFNQVFLPYCSGDLFLGLDFQASQRIKDLRFSGYHNVMGTIEYLLQKFALYSADAIIYTGSSAGGIGAVATIEDVANFITAEALKRKLVVPKIVGAPIAGFYFNNDKPYKDHVPAPISYIPWSYQDLKKYATFWNAKLPTACSAKGNAWECMFAARQYETMKTPMFFTHAQTDSTVMPLHDGLPAVWTLNPPQCDKPGSTCPSNVKTYIQSWAKDMFAAQSQVIKAVASGKRRDGMFSAACLKHTNFNENKPLIKNTNFLTALAKWFNGGNPVASVQNLHIDSCMNGGAGSPACGVC